MPGQVDPAQRLARLGSSRMIVVELPAEAGRWSRDAVWNCLLADWRTGIATVVADLTAIVNWSDGLLDGLGQAQSDLASHQVALRLVVWSQELYAALRQRTGGELTVHANLPAALRDP